MRRSENNGEGTIPRSPRLVSSFPIESSSQDDSIADQIASQPANRFFDRVGVVARFRLQISEFDKFFDDRRRYSGPLETVSTASATRRLPDGRIADWAAEKPR
jgi:hypothetical protein